MTNFLSAIFTPKAVTAPKESVKQPPKDSVVAKQKINNIQRYVIGTIDESAYEKAVKEAKGDTGLLLRIVEKSMTKTNQPNLVQF